MKVKTFAKAMGAGLGAAAALFAAAGPAAADPADGDYRVLAGAGSDTTQDVLNGLGEVVVSGGGKVIASYDARGSATIKTKATGCEFPRPNGSTAGRTALRASEGENGGVFQGANVVGCVDFARSSSYPNASSPTPTGSYTYVPFGVDAVTYAINTNSDLPLNLTLNQLRGIYQCTITQINGVPVTPLLIQSGSGTRQFWLQQMQITEAEIAAGDYPCLEDLGNTVQEHDGTVLTGHNEYLLPYSIAQYLAQSRAQQIEDTTGVQVVDRRGEAILGSVDGVSPTNAAGNLNIDFPVARDVYNVVPTADLASAAIDQTFTGADSLVCQADETIQLFGFGFRATAVDALHNACGATDVRANT